MAERAGSGLTRRALLRAGAVAGAGLLVGTRLAPEVLAGGPPGSDPELDARWPAFRLRIGSPAPGTAPEVDLRCDFGAAGDGVQDDAGAFQALAGAANTGAVAAGTVVTIPPGTYRVVGDETITFRRPIVLRGAGPERTVIQLEYTRQRSMFMLAAGQGMYAMHTMGLYDGRQGQNGYPNAAYSAVLNMPRRGDSGLAVAEPERFAPGDAVYLLCDDYGGEVVYTPTNWRLASFLLKQHFEVRSVEGGEVQLAGALRHDFAGAEPRLYRWQPLPGFGIEHLAILDRSTIPDSDEANTFRAVRFDGLQDGWVWDVHFLDNTSIPLSVSRSRRVVVCECRFAGARHVGAGGNGYLPELYMTDDSLVEYNTSEEGRHALICNWTCWGNVFRYNRVLGTPNTETHGEYSVETLYLRNDTRAARMDVGGGGTAVHAHDGPFNTLVENYAGRLRVLKREDRQTELTANWFVQSTVDQGTGTSMQDNVQVPPGWDAYPYAAYCGHDHTATRETARPW